MLPLVDDDVFVGGQVTQRQISGMAGPRLQAVDYRHGTVPGQLDAETANLTLDFRPTADFIADTPLVVLHFE